MIDMANGVSSTYGWAIMESTGTVSQRNVVVSIHQSWFTNVMPHLAEPAIFQMLHLWH